MGYTLFAAKECELLSRGLAVYFPVRIIGYVSLQMAVGIELHGDVAEVVGQEIMCFAVFVKVSSWKVDTLESVVSERKYIGETTFDCFIDIHIFINL